MSVVSPSKDLPTNVVSEVELASLVRRSFDAELVSAAMPGGASTRRYFRLTLPEGKTAVAMFVPEGGKPEGNDGMPDPVTGVLTVYAAGAHYLYAYDAANGTTP